MIQASQIREHAEVVGVDGLPVGTVDGMAGDNLIKLTKNDPQAQGEHHFIPLSWVKSVEGSSIVLTKTGQQARDEWQGDPDIGYNDSRPVTQM